jgi:hypothetical protein
VRKALSLVVLASLLFSCTQIRGRLEWRSKKYATYNKLTYAIVLLSLSFVSVFLSGGGDKDMLVASYEKGSDGYNYIENRFGKDTYLAVATDESYVLIWDESDGIKKWYVLRYR